MVTMAVIMESAGMTDALARGLAVGLGGIYPFVAPWIGALGAFMTGSNTNSNVVFGGLQLQTARSARLSGGNHPGSANSWRFPGIGTRAYQGCCWSQHRRDGRA